MAKAKKPESPKPSAKGRKSKAAGKQVPEEPRASAQSAGSVVMPAAPSAEDAIRTFRDRRLSLWQSVVEEAVARRAASTAEAVRGVRSASPLALESVRGSEAARAATDLAAALAAGQPLADPQPTERAVSRGVVGTAWKCNKLALQLAWAKATGDTHSAQVLGDELHFGTCDPLWAECVDKYVVYFHQNQGSIPYRSGGDYVLNVNVPAQATVAVFGDWGTGTDAAVAVLRQIADRKPDLAIHLGDIYYSGTQAETQGRFLDVCRDVLGNTPLVSLAGNHDMYSGGEGYYWLVDQLGQQASYFCIRNDDWQFLGMDTGYHDYNPFTVSSNVTSLTRVEAAWHQAKIQDGVAHGRRTVLLSHHQPFSAYEKIGSGYVNQLLLNDFQDLLGNVPIWFWGHEHALSIYGPYAGLQRGRCVGCSAIPVFVEDKHYEPKSDVPLLPDPNHPDGPILLGDNGTTYQLGYAVMRLDGKKAEVAYYQDSDPGNPLYVDQILPPGA